MTFGFSSAPGKVLRLHVLIGDLPPRASATRVLSGLAAKRARVVPFVITPTAVFLARPESQVGLPLPEELDPGDREVHEVAEPGADIEAAIAKLYGV